MTTADWWRVIDEADDMGVPDVQFIGGEPTLHPDLPDLIRHALSRGLKVEVYTNLVRVTPTLWDVFSLPGVRLATSYYSADPAWHDAITGRHSHDRTLSNIAEAEVRGIPIRVGVVEVEEGQNVDAAVARLLTLGIQSVRVDRMREVGRGARDEGPSVDQLCGSCADGTLAVLPTGEVVPCVFARWLSVGNAHRLPLADIDAAANSVREKLTAAFAGRVYAKCDPDKCPPDDDEQVCRPVCDPVLNCKPFKG